MSKKCKISVICALMIALAIVSSFFMSFTFSPDIADALLPDGYVDKVIDNGYEWWSKDEYLGLPQLKKTVDGWKSSDAYDFEYLKSNPIIVAVIDSGVNIDHELFSGKYGKLDENGVSEYDVLLRDGNGTPILKNTATSYVGSYKENDVTDDEVQRHGTHVAGIVAMLIHALDLEQYIKILPIKSSYHMAVSNIDRFTDSTVKNAVVFALSNGADVINMSLSSSTKEFAGLDTSLAYQKAVIVAAAGNDGYEFTRFPAYPASLPNVIGVMNYTFASDGTIVLNNKSNYGGKNRAGYDLCAPGTAIYSADGMYASGLNYKALSGTSMASPIVSFGIALLAMKYKALAGSFGEEMDPVQLADIARSAYSEVITTSENGKPVGECKVFDLNKLVEFFTYEARIDVEDSTLLKQRLGNAIKPINLKLSVMPSSEYGKGQVEWFANGVKVASGFEISYLPEAVVGDTELKAVWKHTCEQLGGEIEREASVVVSVDYMLVSASSLKNINFSATDSEGELIEFADCKIGETYRLSVEELDYVPENDAKNCLWFVNGAFAHKGTNYDFTPSEEGRYEIKIKLNGFESSATVIEIVTQKPDVERKFELKIFTIVISCVVGAIAIIIVSVVIARHVRKKKSK